MNALQEMRPTPRDTWLGMLADALAKGKAFGDKAQIPQGVPLVGGQGLGSLLLGQAPEEVNEWSYGNAPIRVNALAGRTAGYMPEVKPGRQQGLLDVAMMAPVPGARNALAVGAGGLLDGGAVNQAIFMGAKSKTWNKEAAERAAAMERAGADPRAIWQETGTFKGADGKWRQEIDDSTSRLIDNKAAREYMEGPGPAEYPLGPVGGVIDHPQLGAAYPDVMQIKARMRKGQSGAYIPQTGFGEGFNLPSSGTHSTGLHELQHAIQGREGFAKGGSPAQFGPLTPGDRDVLFNNIDAQLRDLAIKRGDGTFIFSGFERGKPETMADPQIQALLAKRAAIASSRDPVEQYRRLAGEAEARAVQKRMGMNALERRQTFPFDSYDVPINDLIVLR